MASERSLRMYMVFSGDAPGEGACLVFAHKAQEARLLGYPVISGWQDLERGFLDVSARWLRDADHGYLRSLLPSPPRPCVIDSPPSCDSCLMWGCGPLVGGRCPDCRSCDSPANTDEHESKRSSDA
jgi:hypothetical protein